MRKIPSVCDYFVIASGTSTTQVRAISDNIARKLKDEGERIWHIEGQREALWVLLDYGDVVAHVFCDQTRRFYDLERLWGDAPQEKFKESFDKSSGLNPERSRRVEGRKPSVKRKAAPRVKKRKTRKSSR